MVAKFALNLANRARIAPMKLSRDIQSLSVFKRDTSKFLKKLKETGQPLVLTVNGKPAAVVMDPDEYEFLLELDRRDTIAAVNRGIADIEAGRTKPAEQVFREIEERFGIPHE